MNTTSFKKPATLLLCILCFVQLMGCSDNSSPVGAWELTAGAWGGESADVSELGSAEMQLNSDGTAELIADEASAKSTWSYENGTLIIDGQTWMFDNDVISFNHDGVYLKFTKK